jgi:hypothetical protein
MISALGHALSLSAFLSKESGFSSYTVLAALLLSALWFYAGQQELRKEDGRRGSAFFWQAVGVWVLLAYCIGAIAWRAWVGLAVAVVALGVELLMMNRRWWSGKSQ